MSIQEDSTRGERERGLQDRSIREDCERGGGCTLVREYTPVRGYTLVRGYSLVREYTLVRGYTLVMCVCYSKRITLV